ncbi:MAG: nucleotidyltransferase family protein [Bacillota bacterium]|nr:MAG: hypothetical protein DIU70_05230 [Bacillota bacterium]
MLVNAIVLAGAANRGPLREVDPAPNEALIPIAGRPMVQYVIDGLRASGRVGRILIVAPPGQLEPYLQGEDLEFVPARGDIVDNVLAALARLPQDQMVMIASSDIPLITGEIVRGLLDLCAQREADVYYPVVERSVADRCYPGVKRTYVRLREGSFTGGNIFVFDPRIADRVAPKVRSFLQYRKNPVRMAGLLGWTFVVRLFLRSLSLRGLEEHVSRLWGIRGAVVICPYPEVGIDVDKPSDLQLARAALGRALTG